MKHAYCLAVIGRVETLSDTISLFVVISVTKCVQRLKLSVSYPVEFVIHYNLIRYAAVITFYVTIVNHYV